MDNKRITYEKITGYIRQNPPVIENPEELTQSILRQIERAGKNKKKHTLLHIMGFLSGTAACLLLCLLLHETVYFPAYHGVEAKDTKQTYTKYRPKVEKKDIAGIIEEKIKNRNRKERIYSAFLYKLNNESK
jgi:hypothetical protein